MPIANTKDNLKLNDFLVQRRKFLKIGFGDLVAKTGIPAKHLKKIEKGEWCDLPSGVYVKGFLKKYTQAVGLDESEAALRYETEWNQICALPVMPSSLKDSPRFYFLKQFSFRKILTVFTVVLVLGYMGWQFKVILEKPDLDLNYPKEEDIVSTAEKLELSGNVSRGAYLTINSETIYPEEDGSFKKEIDLLNGLNVFKITAASRFGQETKVIRRVTYQQNN